jgi:hypothetical protein
MKQHNFGDYSILGPTTHYFKKAPGWWWKFRAPTSGDELEMTRFIYKNRDGVDSSGNRIYLPPTSLEISHREIAVLFDSTNIPDDYENPVEMGGAPILKAGASAAEVEKILWIMPSEMVNELWYAVAEANPDGKWGPEPPKAKKETLQETDDLES